MLKRACKPATQLSFGVRPQKIMLKEDNNVRQEKGESKRRWFFDDTLDLIVWFSRENAILGFQLCYNKPNDEHAITWHDKYGYAHNKIDDGENKPGKHKESPILIEAGHFDKHEVLQIFMENCMPIEDRVVKYVTEKIKNY